MFCLWIECYEFLLAEVCNIFFHTYKKYTELLLYTNIWEVVVQAKYRGNRARA